MLEEVEKINKIEERLEKIKERKEVLNKLIISGVLDASIYTKESMEISSEESYLVKEKKRYKKAILGNDEEIRELEKLIEILDKPPLNNSVGVNLSSLLYKGEFYACSKIRK